MACCRLSHLELPAVTDALLESRRRRRRRRILPGGKFEREGEGERPTASAIASRGSK